MRRDIKKVTTRNDRLTGKKMLLRLTAYLASASLAIGVAGFLIKSIKEYIKDKYNGTAYVYNIENDGKVIIYDEFGDELEIIDLNDGIPNFVISTEKIGRDESAQKPVYVLDDDGNIVSGYIESSDIDREHVRKIRDLFGEDENWVNIGIVSAPNGALAQDDKKAKKNISDNGELLVPGTYVLCGSIETSKDNAYTWRKILYFKDGEIPKAAYMDDNDILNIEELDECRKIKVTNEFLRVRKTPNIDADNVQYKLNQGDIVYQIPNIAEKKNQDYDWIPIVYRNTNTNSFELGWIAGIDRIVGEVYVEEVVPNNEDREESEGSMIKMCVDTTSVGGINLKVREVPGINSGIIDSIPHGTEICITRQSFENPYECDGFEWGKLVDMDGYVAIKYLREIEKTEEPITDNPILNDPQDTRIEMIVDTSSAGNADLKLREAPGTDSKIKMKLQDGTTVYTTQRFIDEAKKSEVIDGHKWIQVIAEDGTTGVVAYDYIVEKRIEMIVDTSLAGNADLKLREEPGTDAKIKMKLQDGTTVYTTQRLIDEAKQSEKIDGYTWIKIIAENGEEGYVADKYIVEAEKEDKEKFDLSTVQYRNVDVFSEGKVKGVLVIDVSPSYVSIGEFKELLEQDTQIPGGKYGDKVQGVMINIGGTGYGNTFCIVGKNQKTDAEAVEKRKQEARAFITVCEEKGIPYGTYYYSQARNKEEKKVEVDYIVDLFEGLGELKYNVFGIAVDVEELQGRMGKFANQSQKNRAELTELKQEMMRDLRNQTGQKVIMYSDKNALDYIIDYRLLTDEAKKDIWLVDCGQKHSDGLRKMGLIDDVGMRQVELDVSLDGIPIDINYMNLGVYQSAIEKCGVDNVEYVEIGNDLDR